MGSLNPTRSSDRHEAYKYEKSKRDRTQAISTMIIPTALLTLLPLLALGASVPKRNNGGSSSSSYSLRTVGARNTLVSLPMVAQRRNAETRIGGYGWRKTANPFRSGTMCHFTPIHRTNGSSILS